MSQKWQTIIANDINDSEYSIEDDRFEIVAEKQKITSMSQVKAFNVTERLYTVKH